MNAKWKKVEELSEELANAVYGFNGLLDSYNDTKGSGNPVGPIDAKNLDHMERMMKVHKLFKESYAFRALVQENMWRLSVAALMKEHAEELMASLDSDSESKSVPPKKRPREE